MISQQSIRKPFSLKTHNETDNVAKSMGISLMEYYLPECKVVENPDKYGIDLLIIDKKTNILKGFVEVEVKKVWTGKFKFSTLNIPFRKKKFLFEGVFFVVFNSDLSSAFVVTGKDVSNSDVKEVKNIHISRGEFFFKIPIKNCYYFTNLGVNF